MARTDHRVEPIMGDCGGRGMALSNLAKQVIKSLVSFDL